MRAAALYGALGSLVLSALTTLPADALDGARPDDATRGVATAARLAAARGIRWGACPAAERLSAPVRCGTVSVPLDYARPSGKHISLTVSRARATGSRAEHQGALVYNPGGPGGSGMFFPLLAGVQQYRATARAYDFVGYAPRGVGRSAPLSCMDPARFVQAPTQAPEHPSEAYKRERIAQAKAYAKGCARRIGRDLPHFTSLNNARDLDVLRAALGERRLTYMGASYGTYFGALYATLFPGHVRRMVFDSVVNPSPRKIWYRSNLDQSAAFERRWNDWCRWVARHDAVYHLGRTRQQVRNSYDRASGRLARRPVGGKIGPGQLQAALLQAGYADSHWAGNAHALAAYLRGDDKPLRALAMPDPASARAEENSNAVYTAVECNDAEWPKSWAVWDRDNTLLARRAPFETWTNAWMNLPCAFWTTPRQRPADVRVGRHALPRTLVLAAERDAATPYPGALELQRRLPGSALVTERGAGTHGIAYGPNACVNAHTERYLLTGAVPGRRAWCAPRPEPAPTADE
ncbi:alpha/beta hydrolase [Streptomyces sp. ISL-11]|uniref:alpha/beta hydrolase n=1 Tax=Streptomyces sp. ISL-11 TaxID=2819174 RepID=UPI001BE54C0E|nr:alpha/beta hydrolase [Streptomyces sp. ISL-11]MBT2382328.1 alpha/beta fold hydrolase [Streptomyces sp. ISL-11]